MKRNIFNIFAVLMVLAMVISPASASNIPENFENNPPPRTPTELPQEIIDEFRDGMTIEEFLVRNQGPIPNALLKYADLKVTVVVQLEKLSLIEYMGQVKSSPESMAASVQSSYVQALKSSQKPFIAEVEKLGGDVMGQYTKTINGFMARVSAKELNTIRSLPGVKAVSRAPQHEITLSTSVPLINANEVWNMPVGFTGTGITVAVIDTGIDYTHSMLGGSGDPNDYASNNKEIIEPGTYPTLKVIGGYDFAGTDYNADPSSPNYSPIPVPDPDPLDENGHGTHVASTVAGLNVGFGNGVAHGAFLYALKVFGAAGSTNLVMDAIEWAMDPNGDGNISDHVDVINMSLGSSFGPNDVNDPELIVVEAASQAGVFVVASAGNAGNISYIVGSPSVSDSALSVAASTTGYETLPYIEYGLGSMIPYMPSSDNPFTTTLTAELVDVDTLDEATFEGTLCNLTDIPDGSLNGKIALIQRGPLVNGCSFSVKIDNATAKGAIGVIIYNHSGGGDSFISMDTSLALSGIPAGFIMRSNGLTLKSIAPLSVSIGSDFKVDTFVSPTPADTIGTFSSRGPRGFDSKLKPEITAPGVAIYAAAMGSGTLGVSYNGTSMAAPHVAGVAALIKQARPGWTNEQIKAAIMNTAVDLAGAGSAQIPRQGAGRVDAFAALNTNVVAVGDPKLVSLSWGVIEVTEATYSDVKTVTLHNFTGADITLDVATVFTSASAGALLTPSEIELIVPALGATTIDVTLDLDATLLPLSFGGMEEYYGFVTFTGAEDYLRVPFYFVPRPYTEITEVESETTFDIHNDFGYVDLTQNGPKASSLWAFPVFLVDENEPDVLDMGDLRYVGLDYAGYSASYGDIFASAFAMWGPVHNNQPYFSEVDLYIDADQDGNPETVNFNFNYGWLLGASNNQWVVVQVDYSNDMMYLGSPYLIYADYNSGFQEWLLPASWNYVSTTFDYEVYSYDWYGMEDYAGMTSFDISKPSLAWSLTNSNPINEDFSLDFWVSDIEGYHYSKPQGIMLVDYYGQPGIGQAYYWPISALYHQFFPVIMR